MLKTIGKQSGFSIMEVAVSIFIITIGLIGVLSLAVQNIKAQYINKNNLIASQLAQEGLELVRNIRDTNWLISDNDWKTGAGAFTNTDIVQDGNYAIDYTNIYNVDDIDSARLNINTTDKFYVHSVGEPTPFYRLITVNDNTYYLEIECKVRWKEKGRTHDYVAKTLLYNWILGVSEN